MGRVLVLNGPPAGSLNWQNLQMYMYGIVISLVALIARGLPLTAWFTHYNGYTWGLVVLGGFTVGLVLTTSTRPRS